TALACTHRRGAGAGGERVLSGAIDIADDRRRHRVVRLVGVVRGRLVVPQVVGTCPGAVDVEVLAAELAPVCCPPSLGGGRSFALELRLSTMDVGETELGRRFGRGDRRVLTGRHRELALGFEVVETDAVCDRRRRKAFGIADCRFIPGIIYW